MCDQAIHIRIICPTTKSTFCVSFICGHNNIVFRRGLWDNLKGFGVNCLLSWILLGDFNNVLSQTENKGGLIVANCETKDFIDCISSLEFWNLKAIGCKHTWMSPSVCSKLDCVLINPCWMISNLNGLGEFIASSCVFDHSLSIVSFLETIVKKKAIQIL